MTPEEELTKEQQRMLIKAIGIAFVVTMLILAFLTLVADKVFYMRFNGYKILELFY